MAKKGGGGGGGGNKGGGGGGGGGNQSFVAQFQPKPAPAPPPPPKPAPQQIFQAAPKPAPQPVYQPAPKPAPQPVYQPVYQPAPKPAPQPVYQPPQQQIFQPAPKAAPQPAAKQFQQQSSGSANNAQRNNTNQDAGRRQDQKDKDKKQNQPVNIFTQIAQKANSSPASSGSGTKKQSSGGAAGGSGGGGGGKVADLKDKLKDIIQSSQGGAIADPQKFKKLLDKLKDTGNKKAVNKIQDLKKETLSSQRTPVTPGPTTPSGPSTPTTPTRPTSPTSSTSTGAGTEPTTAGAGPTGEEAGQAGGGFNFEQQAEDLLAGFDEKFETDFGRGESAFQEDRSTAAGTFESDIQKFLDEFRSDQAGRQSALEDTLTDLAAQGAEFDPERFRTTLLELESSRRRQKDWNERSARQAYKY